MEKLKTRKTNKSLFIIGSLILLSGLTLAGFNLYSNYNDQQKIDDGIKNYYEKEETEVLDNEIDNSQNERDDSQNTRVEKQYDYIAILRIPKIDLENGLVDKNSKYNNIRYNIMIHKESDNPEKDGGNVILVAHSGSSKVSYFKYLYKLKLGDKVYLDYKGKTYTYKLINIYDIEKTGKASIRKNTRKSSITLITCRTGTNKQIVLIGELEWKKKFKIEV